jgi:hypothetical protein
MQGYFPTITLPLAIFIPSSACRSHLSGRCPGSSKAELGDGIWIEVSALKSEKNDD